MVTDNYADVTEEELWIQYKKNKDGKIRDYLIRKYAPLVKYVAGKVAIGKPGNIEYDDLVGFGVFGLMDAIEKFDPNKNVKFKTYAVTRIRGSIYDELRSIDWVPRSIRQKAKEVEHAIQKIESLTGRIATDEEIAAELNIEIREFYSVMTKISGTSLISLSDTWYSGNDSDKISILDTIESPNSLNPDISVEREAVKELVVNGINELPEKEKKVLVLYYYEDLTLKEIGEVLDVTESRVSQLHTKAIIRLRAKLAEIKEGIS
ncbi:MAG TPA: RNA polymerase sigma factor WhiG [Spirochaetia bacterium]|nr:RNA polymerase sigma factor WhiG [Spirochaetia bacterium]HBI36558.1 RNA polymerase sigma factor WhiG [Spirochaetia bacterium]